MNHRIVAASRSLLIVAMALLCAACNQSTPATGAALSPASHSLSMTVGAPQPLSFYEGEDDLEPWTPFLDTPGAHGTVFSFGYPENEGASYLATYNASTWQVVSLSNGFATDDPQWHCDDSPELATTIAADGSAVARSCPDGSLTVFALPDALPIFHLTGTSNAIGLYNRVPVAVFSPDSQTLAVTDDSPAGPGQTISLFVVPSGQPLGQFTTSAALLSRPAWSPDGTRIAAVTLDGMLRLWDAQSGNAVSATAIPGFAAGTNATDPAGPAPQWTADGKQLYVTAPVAAGTQLSYWTVTGATLARQAAVTIPFPPYLAYPELAPDGSLIFARTGLTHGQVFTAPALRQVGDSDLPGSTVIWGADAHHLTVFTTHATVVPLTLGGLSS